MRLLLLIAALAVASPNLPATPVPPTPPVAVNPPAAPVHDIKNAVPSKRFQIYDSLRQLAPDRFGQPQPMPKDGAGPGIG